MTEPFFSNRPIPAGITMPAPVAAEAGAARTPGTVQPLPTGCDLAEAVQHAIKQLLGFCHQTVEEIGWMIEMSERSGSHRPTGSAIKGHVSFGVRSDTLTSGASIMQLLTLQHTSAGDAVFWTVLVKNPELPERILACGDRRAHALIIEALKSAGFGCTGREVNHFYKPTRAEIDRFRSL